MIRLLLSLLMAANAAQAAPTASRAGSATPGRLPVLSPALSLSQGAAASALFAPTLGTSGLPALSAPTLPNTNAAAPAASITASPSATPNAAPVEVQSQRPSIFAPREERAVNRADDQRSDAEPTAIDTAETLAEDVKKAGPNKLQQRMAAAFDGSGKPLHILMTAGEANPYIKTGGLADVVGDVGPGLVEAGHKVSLVIPLYGSISPKEHGLKRLPGAFAVPVGDKIETARLWTTKEKGVDVYFIEHEEFFGRRGAYGYNGTDFEDNDARYIFHSRAALEAMRFLDTPPDIAHAHDWHVGLIPAYLKLIYNNDPFFAATRSVMTIHNIAYQGTFPAHVVEKAGFSMDNFRFDQLEYYGNLSYLKAGIAFADAVTTVSPTYAKEIQTDAFGHGLDPLLVHRSEEMVGILNGIDPEFYNPKTDPRIDHNYEKRDVREGKSANKLSLQTRFNLNRLPDVPVFGIASRLAHQKGIDLVAGIIDYIVEKGGQVIITGSGDANLEEAMDALVKQHPKSVFRHGFDTIFVHMVYAVSDFLLMPSRFEPCGLSQMMAHAYGGLPIATRTGGLADSIIDLNADPKNGNGFFVEDFTVDALKKQVAAAFALYHNRTELERVQRGAMGVDHSWASSLAEYQKLYRALLKS